MNAQILNNLLARFYCNEEKAIVWAKRHALLEWDRLQVDLQYTPEVLNPTLVKLASDYIFSTSWHDCMGCRCHPFQCASQVGV
jgi:hypothetical protein